MQETNPSLPAASLPQPAALRARRFIYIVAPWTSDGGSPRKVGEYLVRSQAAQPGEDAAQLRPLDARGVRGGAWPLWVLLTALAKIVAARVSGRLAGVHLNVARRASFARQGAIVAFSHLLGLPVVLHLHGATQRWYERLPSSVRAAARWVCGLADAVVVTGPGARRFVTDELKVPADRVDIVISGVPAPTQPRRVRRADDAQRVLFLGELGRGQGADDLLHALARPGFDPDRLEVTLAGAGAGDVEGYRTKAAALGIAGFVNIPGACNDDEAARLLADADVLVLPSHDEVLPLAVLEALANGVAVVCTPVGELASLLTDGRDTLFVKAGDVDGIAATLQRLLADPQLRERLERNGQVRYGQQFSLGHFVARVARVHRRTFGTAAEPDVAPSR
jgi:glycosyltransferase involved in cell wall biosynthesis